MTKEEAIKIIEIAQAQVEWDWPLDYATAFDVAIAALRTQHIPLDRSRWEGCPACKNGEIIAWDLCNDGIVIETDGKLHMLSGGDWETEIKFCPMCGRPLIKEAWAGLKKRINPMKGEEDEHQE